MNHIKTFLILLISFSFTINALGQQTPVTKSTKIEYIIAGTYCGECFYNCARMYKLVNNELYIDPTDDYYHQDNLQKEQKNLAFSATPLSNKQYLLAKKIQDSIPGILYASESKTFGGPDNRDQCGIFLQIKTADKLKTFYIDTDLKALPKELRKYAVLLVNTCNELNKTL